MLLKDTRVGDRVYDEIGKIEGIVIKFDYNKPVNPSQEDYCVVVQVTDSMGSSSVGSTIEYSPYVEVSIINH